ncbi:MAG: 30S ribosomal protein S9 [Candidatus Moranbacteria bacterium]|nr:30S ribosomal protein S9 [Candidatus Moranbacteria bacterium]
MAVKKALKSTTGKVKKTTLNTTLKKAEKATAKVVKEVTPKVEKKAIEDIYFYGVGRRKSSVAQVRLYSYDKATDSDFIINKKKLKDYFPGANLQNTFLSPLKAVGLYGKMRVTVLVRGGGVTGQIEAVRLGISRALVKYDETLKKSLKDFGYMTRDAREVERKKPGLKKARKAPQWAKR